MKDFDLNKIGKKMPYKAPTEDFFESFTNELLSRVESQQPKRTFALGRSIASLLGIAAAIAVVLTITFNIVEPKEWSAEFAMSESIEESLDSYLGSLSDAELENIATDSSYHNDFFVQLSENI